jgi:Urocanase Rossmann-like domain
VLDLVFRVERFYAALIQAASPSFTDEPNLGGKLLYVGELDEQTRALVIAGSVAGAATLAVTADVAAQKQAIRDGVVDFLVISLDEALRILKNEIRKHERVAVCVALTPEQVEREMNERGVQPDLFRHSVTADLGVRPCIAWGVDSAPARWLPRLDVIAIECLETAKQIERRWVRLAPRYLGRMAQGVRMVVADREFASRFVDRVRMRVESGEIGVSVSIQLFDIEGSEQHHFTPKC